MMAVLTLFSQDRRWLMLRLETWTANFSGDTEDEAQNLIAQTNVSTLQVFLLRPGAGKIVSCVARASAVRLAASFCTLQPSRRNALHYEVEAREVFFRFCLSMSALVACTIEFPEIECYRVVQNPAICTS